MKTSSGTVLESESYVYDPFDNRIGTVSNGVTTWTLYDGRSPIMDFSSTGALEVRYLQGPTGILARESASGVIAWYLSDRLGTVSDLIDNSGNVIDHVDYTAFGSVIDETAPSAGDRFVSFAGLVRDNVTGLNLAVERVENPAIGRWTQQDPLSFSAGDTNLYRYVGNGATDGIDPLGLTEGIPIPGPGNPTIHIDGESMGTRTTHVQFGPPGNQMKIRLPVDMKDINDLPNVPGVPKQLIRKLLKNPMYRKKLQNQLNNARKICKLSSIVLTIILAAPEVVQAAEEGGLLGAASAAGNVALDTAVSAGETVVAGATILEGATLAGTSVTTGAGVVYVGVGGAATVGGASILAGGVGFGIGYGIGSVQIGNNTVHEHLGNVIYWAAEGVSSGASTAWNWLTDW